VSIIIKGMEMPTTCCDCKLIFFDETRKWEQMTGAYVCQMTGKVIWNTRRGDDCPLIELPPHGRLIDADALIDVLGKMGENEYTPKVFANWLEWEINAPTIIPADPGREPT